MPTSTTSSRGLPSPVFLDTSYAVALAVPSDACHQEALHWAVECRSNGLRLVTTLPVCLEIGNWLSRVPDRRLAGRLLDELRHDAAVTLLPLGLALYDRALGLYTSRPDKDWGLTDCVSFAAMDELGLTDALTADRHFVQAGFRALLLEQ
jgi:uncharacterized protein